ncbi:pilus assembly protein HofM [Gibbsiella quercinecans]|nr:pilus assembly protein HofM [Gibbsiella quercinecans]
MDMFFYHLGYMEGGEMRLSQVWQVGLDIQQNSVCALAALRRRGGWQLRHWWQQPLPQPVLRDGYLDHPQVLIAALRQWRVRLPKHISLRIALPAQRILQQAMPVPDARLREPMRHDYITAQGGKRFPLDREMLALDYRPAAAQATSLLLTAARQQELQQWLHCLQAAGLHPDVVDITPCALASVAAACGLAPEAGLLHHLEQAWLWVGPRSAPFTYGVLRASECHHAEQALAVVREHCPALGEKEVYYSSMLAEGLPEGAVSWSPFTAFAQLSPPLPALTGAFVLAAGLALREEDS